MYVFVVVAIDKESGCLEELYVFDSLKAADRCERELLESGTCLVYLWGRRIRTGS